MNTLRFNSRIFLLESFMSRLYNAREFPEQTDDFREHICIYASKNKHETLHTLLISCSYKKLFIKAIDFVFSTEEVNKNSYGKICQ